MDPNRLSKKSSTEWWLAPTGRMRVPGIIFASEELVRAMDEKVLQQVANVAGLPGIVRASFAMPDAHWGYGFPIGGVAAFFGLSNRMANMTGMRPNDEFYLMGRVPKQK